jgi:hypothetical protein
MLEVAPKPFIGIEVGGVSRKELNAQAFSVLVDKVLNGLGLVGAKVVPDEDDTASDVAQKVTEENHELWFGYGAAPNEDEEAIVHGDARYGGNFGPRIAVA